MSAPTLALVPEHCMRCEYSLAGRVVGESCPECGTVIAAMHLDGPLRERSARRALHQAAWCMTLAAIAFNFAFLTHATLGVLLYGRVTLQGVLESVLRSADQIARVAVPCAVAVSAVAMFRARPALPRGGFASRTLACAAWAVVAAAAVQITMLATPGFLQTSSLIPSHLGLTSMDVEALALGVFAVALHSIARGARVIRGGALICWLLCAWFVVRAISGELFFAFVINGRGTERSRFVGSLVLFSMLPLGAAVLALLLTRLTREVRAKAAVDPK